MGRRSRNHSYVKFILLMDNNGNIRQRHELDDSGKLIHPLGSNQYQYTMPVMPSKPVEVKPQVTSPPPEVMHTIPIPPVLRSKASSSFLSSMSCGPARENFQLPTSIQSSVHENNAKVIDIRPQRMMQMQGL